MPTQAMYGHNSNMPDFSNHTIFLMIKSHFPQSNDRNKWEICSYKKVKDNSDFMSKPLSL